MKLSLALVTVFFASTFVRADIVPLTFDVNAAFEKSDAVCSGFVSVTTIISERRVSDSLGRTVIRQRVRANVEVYDQYKWGTTDPKSIAVEFDQDVPATSAQPTLWKG